MSAAAQRLDLNRQTTSATSRSRSRVHPAQTREVSAISELRRSLGNQALQRLLKNDAEHRVAGSLRSASRSAAKELDEPSALAPMSPLVQAKLTVSSPNDLHEQEADRVAEEIISSPSPVKVETATQPAPEYLDERMDRSTATDRLAMAPTDGLPIGPGRPLDARTRNEFQQHFGRDLSSVRVHDDARASESAEAVNAIAYTVGRDIVFRDGAFAPETASGKKLLAHELTHVVQQSGGSRQDEHSLEYGEGLPISSSAFSLSRSPSAEEKKKADALTIALQKLIDGAIWKEIRKRVYPKESAAGIKRAKERKTGARPDLTGLGKLATLQSFAAAIKSLQGSWGPKSVDDRVKAIGAAANAELTGAGIPQFINVDKVKTPWKGFFQAHFWKFSISDALVSGPALTNADAAELANTALHEARHAEQHFLAARYSAGPPDNKSAAAIAVEQDIPEDPIAKAAVAAKFDAATDSKVAQLGKDMYKAMVTEGVANQKISDDDYTKEMETARKEAITSLAALKATVTPATLADAAAKRTTLEAAIVEVEKRYTLYRNIPYEADAHEVGDAAEQAFRGWP